jgi:PilZ domain
MQHIPTTASTTQVTPEIHAAISRPDSFSIYGERPRIDRRKHRRHDLELSHVMVERYDGPTKPGRVFGEAMDLSAGGIRVRVRLPEVKIGSQVRIRLTLPVYAGITPFVAPDGSGRGANEWTGWMTVTRMQKVDSDLWDVAGRLVDMREIDRGMLTLYLSAHPLAA